MKLFGIFTFVATLILAIPAALHAQSLETSKHSVVQIRCVFGEGKSIKATGFVWPEPGYVVTALHVIAGCENGSVLHQRAGVTEFAEVVSVDLDSDLALIRVKDDLGLAPVPFEPEGKTPDLLKPHRIYGYPKLAERLRGDGLKFADTLNGETIELGRAYSSDELTRLFRDQDYPTRKTQIYQVGSLLQPGHSGAPIFDERGYLVAIGDGGLLGGWLGMNWSIPAHVYLPKLKTSDDNLPDEISKWAGLFSNVVVEETEVVLLGSEDSALSEEEVLAGYEAKWNALGFLPLGAIIQEYDFSGSPAFDYEFENIFDFYGDDLEDVGFDIYEYGSSDVIFALPRGFEADISVVGGKLEFISKDKVFYMTALIEEAANFEEAVLEGVKPFVEEHGKLAEWEVGEDDYGFWYDAPAFNEVAVDKELEFAIYEVTGFGNAPNSDTEVLIDLKTGVNAERFLGASLTSFIDREMNKKQMALEALLWIAFDEIAGFQGLSDPYYAALVPTTPTSELSLVRRVPLQEVARDFVAERDFLWKLDVFDIKQFAGGQDAYEKLSFDIYEDSETGATVSVPTGMKPVWNDEVGALEVYTDSKHSRMNISVVQADSFDQAIGPVFFSFAEKISNFAKWKGSGSPEDCDDSGLDFVELTAECWLYLQVDTADDSLTDIYIGMSVRDNIFLGTSVFIEGDEEHMTASQAIEWRMMRIAAEYLSDFAVY